MLNNCIDYYMQRSLLIGVELLIRLVKYKYKIIFFCYEFKMQQIQGYRYKYYQMGGKGIVLMVQVGQLNKQVYVKIYFGYRIEFKIFCL